MVNKNTTKKTRKARKNFPLIKFICTIFFLVGVIIFVISVVTNYKTYTDSEIVKANVINVSGTKNDMLEVKYRYYYDGEKYEENVRQSVGEIRAGDEKEIRIRKSIPKKIIITTITTVICNNIAFALSLFASLATIVLLFGLAKKKAEEDSDIEI
mgnify:CR=1 FL=1